MVIQRISEMTPRELEKVLKYLPGPFYVESSSKLENASKEEILKKYEKLYEKRKNGEEQISDFYEIGCYQDNVIVRVIPYAREVNINYRGQEPAYISRMRQELAETNIKLIIKVNEILPFSIK